MFPSVKLGNPPGPAPNTQTTPVSQAFHESPRSCGRFVGRTIVIILISGLARAKARPPMTSIKPPTGPITTVPHTTGDLGGPGSIENPSLGASSPAKATADPQIGSVGTGQPVGLVDLARAVESGHISMSQAVERLVEQTLGSLPGPLTELERSELSQLLKSAVASDPTLGALQDEQG